MTKEHLSPVPENRLECFGFNEAEILNTTIMGKRFFPLLKEQQTIIHSVAESGNAYGDFLFVTASRHSMAITFYGLGFHEYRDRWFTNEWRWYETPFSSNGCQDEMDKEEALQQILDRRDEILRYADNDTQSEEGYLFEMLAELTDDDGAISSFDDLYGFLG